MSAWVVVWAPHKYKALYTFFCVYLYTRKEMDDENGWWKALEWALILLRHGCDSNLIPGECGAFKTLLKSYMWREEGVHTAQFNIFTCGNHIFTHLPPLTLYPSSPKLKEVFVLSFLLKKCTKHLARQVMPEAIMASCKCQGLSFLFRHAL